MFALRHFRTFASLKLKDDQVLLRDAARKFAQAELPKLADKCEVENHPVPKEWRHLFTEKGFLGINIPEKYGGLGLGNLEAIVVLEEFAKISSAVAFPIFEANVGPIKIVEYFGNEKLKQTLIPQVCKGNRVVGIAMSEPNAGTALTDLSTKASIHGSDVVINGNKRWMSGGGHSDMIVFARMSQNKGAGGIGAIYVPFGTPGVTFGSPETLMGFRGIPSADIYFDNVKVPTDNILLPAGQFSNLMSVFNLERCGNATMAFAQAQAAFDQVLQYVQERKQFGRDLVQFQAVQLKLAEMKMKVEASRLLLYQAVSNSDTASNKLPSVMDSSLAKCYANEIAVEVCSHAMQLMGAYGYSTKFHIERRLRDSYGWRIAGGTLDIQKTNIAAALVGQRFNQRQS